MNSTERNPASVGFHQALRLGYEIAILLGLTEKAEVCFAGTRVHRITI